MWRVNVLPVESPPLWYNEMQTACPHLHHRNRNTVTGFPLMRLKHRICSLISPTSEMLTCLVHSLQPMMQEGRLHRWLLVVTVTCLNSVQPCQQNCFYRCTVILIFTFHNMKCKDKDAKHNWQLQLAYLPLLPPLPLPPRPFVPLFLSSVRLGRTPLADTCSPAGANDQSASSSLCSQLDSEALAAGEYGQNLC